jgi:hypothetical protein
MNLVPEEALEPFSQVSFDLAAARADGCGNFSCLACLRDGPPKDFLSSRGPQRVFLSLRLAVLVLLLFKKLPGAA